MSHCRLRGGSDFQSEIWRKSSFELARVAPEVVICILARAVIVLHRAKA
jgi:hypothetical protein